MQRTPILTESCSEDRELVFTFNTEQSVNGLEMNTATFFHQQYKVLAERLTLKSSDHGHDTLLNIANLSILNRISINSRVKSDHIRRHVRGSCWCNCCRCILNYYRCSVCCNEQLLFFVKTANTNAVSPIFSFPALAISQSVCLFHRMLSGKPRSPCLNILKTVINGRIIMNSYNCYIIWALPHWFIRSQGHCRSYSSCGEVRLFVSRRDSSGRPVKVP